MARGSAATTATKFDSNSAPSGLPLTLHYRFNTSSWPSTADSMLRVYVSGTGYGYYHQVKGDAGQTILSALDYDGSFAASNFDWTSLSNNTWYSYCGVFRGTANRQAYIDNSAATVNTTSQTGITPELTGLVVRSYIESCDVAVWSIALSSDERQMLADGIPARKVRPDALIDSWPFIGRNDTEEGIFLGDGMAPDVADDVEFVNNPRLYGQGSANILQFPPVAAAAGDVNFSGISSYTSINGIASPSGLTNINGVTP